MLVILLRDTDAGVGNLYREKLMIRVQKHLDPAVFFIVFNRIFHKVRENLRYFDLVHLCRNRCLLYTSANNELFFISGCFLKNDDVNFAGGLKSVLYILAACAHLFRNTDKQ